MEAMEVDSAVELLADELEIAPQPEPRSTSDSGSSTEVDEEDDEEEQRAVQTPVRLPSTWAFSQRAMDGAAVASLASQGALIQRRLRYSQFTDVFYSLFFFTCLKKGALEFSEFSLTFTFININHMSIA